MKKYKIAYFNCTGVTPHIGCLAVTDSHLRALVSRGYDIVDIFYPHQIAGFWKGAREESLKQNMASPLLFILEEVDAIVINGEGTLHHNRGLGLLAIAEAAKKIKKPVYLLNTVMQEIDGFDDVLKSLDDITVRESASGEELDRKNIAHRVVLDSLLDAAFSDIPDTDFKNGIIVTDWHDHRDDDVGEALIKFIKQDAPDAHFMSLDHYKYFSNWKHTVANFKTARLVVTGRYHAVYMAGMAGTPFVAMPSNTHKIEGLFRSAGIKLPICENYQELPAKIREAESNPSMFADFKAFLDAQRPLKTFNRLYETLPTDITLEKEATDRIVDAHFVKIQSVSDTLEGKKTLSRSIQRIKSKKLKKQKETLQQELALEYLRTKNFLGAYKNAFSAIRDGAGNSEIIKILCEAEAGIAPAELRKHRYAERALEIYRKAAPSPLNDALISALQDFIKSTLKSDTRSA